MRNTLFIRNMILAALMATGMPMAHAADVTYSVSGITNTTQLAGQVFTANNNYVISGNATAGQYLHATNVNPAYGRWTMAFAATGSFGATGETISLVNGAEMMIVSTSYIGTAKIYALNGGLGGYNNMVVSNDIQVGDLTGGTGGLRINGSGGNNYTFSGKITGSGTFNHQVGSNSNTLRTYFTGDVSEFTGTWGGTMQATALARYYQFGNNTSSAVTNGKIGGTFSGDSTTAANPAHYFFAYNDSYQVLGAVTKADILQVINGGTANFMQGFANVNALTVAANSKAVFNGITTLGATTNNGTLEFATGSTATQTATAIGGTGSVVVSGGNVTLSQVNTYSNGTTISDGTLTISNANALGNGAVTLNGGRLNFASGTTTLANAVSIGASGGTIGGAASSVTLSGAVNAVNYSTLTLESDTTFTQNAVLYNVAMAKDKSITFNGTTNTISGNAVLYDVNLGTGATIVLSGVANSIANVNGAAGLGNTVSLAAGITTLAGTANTTFAVASGATFILDSTYVGGAHTDLATASVGAIDAASGSVINVCLTEAFMANFVDADLKTFDLTTLTLQGLNITGIITVNLTTENGYMFGNQTSLTFNNVAGVGGDAVLGGGAGDPVIALTYVPEPMTATLGVLGLAGLLLRRRRRA